MTNAEDGNTRNGDEEITNMAKADAKKTKEVNDDIKKAKLFHQFSSLSVSSGFEIPHIQSPSVHIVPVSVIPEPLILSPIPKILLVAHASTLLSPPSVSTISPVLLQTTTSILTPPITTDVPPVIMIQIAYVLEKDFQERKEVDHTTKICASLISEIPLAVNADLGSSQGVAHQKVPYKHTEELKQHYSHKVDYKEIIEESMQVNVINEVKNQLPKFLPKAVSNFATLVIQSTIKKALEKTPLLLAQPSSQA
uniref:Uncharacterized protein n=1 Tax=Tanacetum cinerariifolium TaxID=118510 RepID=A0A699ILW0_TANCI|nr:hypothetical protein [Tanacetum cinerariifolium]